MDFKKATELFADPLFDGDPVVVYKPGPLDPPVPPDEPYDCVKWSKFVVSDDKQLTQTKLKTNSFVSSFQFVSVRCLY